MSRVSSPAVLHYRLTHADDAPLPTINPAHGTPLIAQGLLAFRPGDPERLVPDSDGRVYWELRDAAGEPLLITYADYLEVAPGHYTLPVGPAGGVPRWRAEVQGDELLLVRRPLAALAEPAPPEPWFLARMQSLRFSRDDAPFAWPEREVWGAHLLPPAGRDGT